MVRSFVENMFEGSRWRGSGVLWKTCLRALIGKEDFVTDYQLFSISNRVSRPTSSVIASAALS